MLYAIMFAISIHVLSAVFWAGSSFTLARGIGISGNQLFRSQMGAAMVAALSGAYLWSALHPTGFGTSEIVLAVGAGCAILAAGVQGAICGRAIRALHRGLTTRPLAETRIVVGQRMGSALLAVTIICMVISRYV